MDGDTLLFGTGGEFCFPEGTLDAFNGHGNLGSRTVLSTTSADGGENEHGVSVKLG